MLTPKAHLRAWLSFTDDATVGENALAGARGSTTAIPTRLR